MRALDTALFALTLVVVPGLAWLTGRAMGRRDWTIGPVIVASGLVALLPHLARLLALAAFDGRAFDVAVFAHFRRAADAPEIGFFFLALGVFMTMLGWTSTPVANRT
jgi:hypothetical protein